MKVVINIPLITLNEYISAERANKGYAAQIKKKLTGQIAFLCKAQKFTLPEKTKFDVNFEWFTPNERTDHDNISFAKKFVLDGIVESGALQKDSPKFVGNFTDKFYIDKSRDYISCTAEFVDHVPCVLPEFPD
jgi:hypothetical protein